MLPRLQELLGTQRGYKKSQRCTKASPQLGSILTATAVFGRVNDNMKFMPRIVTTEELVDYWPAIVTAKKFATLQEALSQCLQPGRCALVVRISTADLEHRAPEVSQRNLHICVNLSYAQARDILTGTAMHETTALLAGSCSCKSKSCVVTNYDLGPIFLQNS